MYKNLNVCFLGGGNGNSNSGVGKSSIISSATLGSYDKLYIPTIENRSRKLLQFNKKVYNIFIHDTSSLRELKFLCEESINLCDSFIIVFSLDDHNSIERIQYYKELIYDTLKVKKGSLPIILVANKIDLVIGVYDQQSISQKIKKIEKLYKLPCIQSTSKDQDTTNSIFKLLIKQVEKKTTKKQVVPFSNVAEIKYFIKRRFISSQI